MFQRQYSRAMKALGPLITALETKLAAVYAPVPPIAVAPAMLAAKGRRKQDSPLVQCAQRSLLIIKSGT